MPNIELSLDFSWIYNLGQLPLYAISWHFFVNGGWILFVIALIYGGWKNFVYMRQLKFASKQSYVYLAIDIPKDNLQTPRAVENIFSAMGGAQTPLEWWEKYLKGEYQLSYSVELVSIDGYIQFTIRTPSHFRNLVEAAVYSQYPDAEITETRDYTSDVSIKFPSDEYNLWGADFVLVRPEYYPIKTYIEFQEELDREFKDPMAALLEVMSKIGPGEQIWMQLIISPAAIGWEKKGMKFVNKVLGVEEKVKKNIFDIMVDASLNLIASVGDQLLGSPPAKDDKKSQFNMMMLNPTQKREVEAVIRKVDRICYNSMLRIVYLGKREVFKKGLGVAGMVGALKQFAATGMNGFKPGKNKTQAKVYFVERRMSKKQNAILKNYKSRNSGTSTGSYLLSVEELATLFHFPYIEVKAPMIRRIEAKKSGAPIGLPVLDESFGQDMFEEENLEKEAAPAINYDNDYFEGRFALDKTGKKDKERKEKLVGRINREKKVNKLAMEEERGISKEKILSQSPIKIKDDDFDIPGNLPVV